CATSATLSANDPDNTQGTGVWTRIGVNSATIVTPTLFNTVVTNLAENTTHGFTWTVTQGSCSASDDVDVNNLVVLADAGVNQSTCNTSYQLSGNNATANGATGVWTTAGSADITSPTLHNTWVTNLGQGINRFTWTVTSSGGCIEQSSVEITYNLVLANAGIDREICDPSINLGATEPAFGSGVWTQLSGPAVTIVDQTLYNTQITGLVGADYAFTWTVTNNSCSGSADVNIINSSPQIATANVGAAEVCDGIGTLIGNPLLGGETGLWSKVVAGGVITDPTSVNTTVTSLTSGLNTFMWTISKGSTITCTSDATVGITNSEVTASATADNLTSCDGTAFLRGNDAGLQGATGMWSVNTSATINDPTANNTLATNLVALDNTFTWTVSKGACDATANVIISNKQIIANAGSDSPVCTSTASFNADNPAPNQGTWSIINAGATTTIADISLFNSQVTGLQPGANIFRWQVSGDGCIDDDFVTITNDTVIVAAGTTTSVCLFEGDLSANALSSGQTGLWISAGANPVIENSTSPATHVTNLDYGTNTFFWTVTTTAGCNSSVEYQLINNSPTPADAGTYPPLCTSTVSLAANNPLYGTGSWSVVGGSGHIVDPTNRTTNVTGLGTGANVLRWTISHNGCDNWDEAIIENNSFTVNAGIDQPNHCSTTTNLNSPDTLSGAWTRISGGSTILNPSLTNTEVTNLSFGENRFLWTVSQNGCTISDEVIVTTNFTEPAITEADKPVCQADNVSIAANGQTYGTGLWTRTGGTGTIVDATDNNTFVNGLSLGPNTFRWTISYQSCSDYNDLIITNNAVVADAGNDQLNLCVGNTALASIEPASGIGSWSLSSGLGIIANSLDENTTVSGLALGDNIFQWSVVNGGCTTFDEVTIRNNSPTQAATGSDQPICSTTTNLSGNNPTVGTGIWSVFGNQATIHTPTLYNTSVTVDPGSTNNFTWTITNGACSTYASMNVINNSFTVYAGIDQTRCSNDALMDATGPQTGTGTWTGAWSTLSGGGVFSNTAQNNATVSNLGPNTNIFRWTVTRNGCTTFDDVNIINRTVTISADDVMTCNDNAILDGNNPALQGNSGLWKTIAPTTVSIAQPTLFNSTVSNLDPGRNNLRWVVSNALCSDSVNVVANYYIPVANAGADRPFGCENFVQLNANQPPSTGNGEWSIAFGGAGVVIHDNTLYNTQVTNLEIGDNEFIWTVTDQGCINSDQITINNSQPENDDGVDQAGCTNTFTLDAEQPSGSGTGLWTLSVGGASFANETLYNTQVTVDRGTNILTWTITDNGCVASKDFAIVNNLTAPQAGEDVPVCVNQIGLAAADPGVDNGSWSIIGGAITEIFDDSTNPNATVTNLRKGNITFVWTVSNAYCSASDNVVVTNNTPNITAGNNRTICENYVTLAGNNPALEADPSTGIWENVNHTGIIVNPTMYNTQVTDLENGANVYRWTVTNTDCSISEEVTITSNIINVDAGVDRTVCDSIVDLSAVTPTTGVWERMNGNATFDNASVYNTTARNLSAFNTFRWNAQSGTCSNYDEVTIYSSLPEIANTEIDKPVCQSSTTITANSPDYSIGETGLWTIPGGSSATIATPTNRDTYITGLDLGPNTFRWTISSNDSPNCTTWNEITVTNNQVVADAGPDQRRCFTDATMNAGGAGTSTGAWTIVGTSTAIIANNSIHNTAISNLSPGINTFKWTVTGTGCTAEDEVVIHNDIPTVPVAGDDQNVCEDSAPLNANNPDVNRGTGIWDHVGGSGIIDNVSEFNTSVSGLANGRNTFRWTIKLNECSLFDDIDIFNNSVTVNAGVPQIICSDEYQLDGNTPVTGNGSWSIIGGVGIFDNSMLPTTWVRNLAKGQNTLRWTIDDGTCVNYDELTIYNNLPVTPVVEADKPVCSDFATIGVNPAPDYLNRESGLWIRTAGNGTIADRTAVNTSVSGLAPDVNTFLWTVTKTTGGVDCSLSDEINITNNSVTASTGVDKPVCGTTSTLSGNDPGTGIGTWTKLSGTGIIAVSNDYNTTVSNLSTGENIFRWTIVRDLCSDFDDVVITNNQYISSANPGGANVLCEDYSEVIADIPPAGTSGQWIMYAGVGTFDDPTSNTTYVRGLGQGPNTIRWVVSKDGCDTNAEFNITNNSVSTEAGDDQVVCTTTTSLTATPIPSGGSGYWTRLSGTGIIDNSASSATSVSNLSLGSNIFTWHVDANGCSDESSLVVTNNTFTVSAGSNEVYCGSTYPLAGEDPAPGYGLWTIENGTGSFANPSSNGTVVSNLSNGDNTFRWTVTRNGCTFYDDVTITNDLYTADAGESFPVCGDQTTVTASALNPVWGATGLWTLENGGGTFANPTSASTIISGLASGNNRLRWTVTKGSCIDYDEIIVTNNLPVISAGTPETTCDDFRTLSATPLSPTGTGLWTGGGLTTTIVDPSSSITLITGLARGTNTFAWTVTDNNCTATSTVTITSNHFDAHAGPDQVVTVNNAVMQAQLPDATATGTWMPISGSGTIGDITNPTEPVTDLGYGENTFRWTVNWSGCTSTDDVNIIYNAITADAGPEYIPTCENIVYMSAIDPFPGTGTWTFVSGTHVPTFSDINNPNMQVSDIEPGGYFTLKWTVMLGGLTDEDQVTVKNNEFSLDAGPEQGVCIDYTQLHAEPAGDGTGSWSVVSGGGIFADNSNNETTVTGLNEGLNLLRWTVVKNNGCQNSDIVEITYNTSPTAAFEMTPTSGCSPIDVVFTNTSFGGSVYYWNFGDKLRTDSSLTTFTKTYEALYDKDSTYSIQLVAESAKGCTDTIVQQVTAYSFPYVGFSASPEFQLFPRSTVYIENLSDPGFVNYSWTFGDGTTQLDPTINEAFDHTYTSWGEFDITLTVSSNNCSGTATQTVTILAPQPATTINPGIRASGCEDLSVDFQAYTIYADTFYWDFGDGGEAHEKNPPYIYDEPGTYIVKLYAGGPGTNYLVNMDNPVRVDTVIVYAEATASFEALPDTVMLPDQPVICHNNSINGETYLWNFGGIGDSLSREKSPVHYYTEPGVYTINLDVWTEHGCHADASQYPIVVEPAGTIVFPNAFNPFSGYQLNKVFKPLHRGIREYKLEIFNRWGEKIFESTDPEIGWDGNIDGKIGAQDVYAWKLTGKYRNGTLFKATGNVTLLR
ncbi:MAG: PKD domain-containing protein, partial [Bacteroidota bacterium]